jgi:beta-xylosidase
LQRYVVIGDETDRKYLNFKTNNRVLQMISREDSNDFLQINRDIQISTFSKIWIFKFVQFNHTFGTAITRDAVKKAKRGEYQWQHGSMTP